MAGIRGAVEEAVSAIGNAVGEGRASAVSGAIVGIAVGGLVGFAIGLTVTALGSGGLAFATGAAVTGNVTGALALGGWVGATIGINQFAPIGMEKGIEKAREAATAKALEAAGRVADPNRGLDLNSIEKEIAAAHAAANPVADNNPGANDLGRSTAANLGGTTDSLNNGWGDLATGWGGDKDTSPATANVADPNAGLDLGAIERDIATSSVADPNAGVDLAGVERDIAAANVADPNRDLNLYAIERDVAASTASAPGAARGIEDCAPAGWGDAPGGSRSPEGNHPGPGGQTSPSQPTDDDKDASQNGQDKDGGTGSETGSSDFAGIGYESGGWANDAMSAETPVLLHLNGNRGAVLRMKSNR